MDNELHGIISSNGQLVGQLSTNGLLNGSIGVGVVQISIKDHNRLENRDLDDQHPISAITGLSNELLSIRNDIQTQGLSIIRLETKIDHKIRTVSEIPSDMQVGEYIHLIKEDE